MYRRDLPLVGVTGLVIAGALASGCTGDPTGSPSGTPTELVRVSGDQQTGAVDSALGEAFTVRVNDQAGNPVAGITVTWSVTAGAGSITPATDTTDVSGTSQAQLTLGPAIGGNTVVAAVQGLGTATFTATGTSGGGGGGGGGGGAATLVFRTIDAGSYHTCAITRTELPYCWGFGQDGELGDGATAGTNVPKAVSGGLNFRQVSGGKFHSCAVTLAGDGYCWGANLEGQLGATVETQSSTPMLNARAITFGAITVGRAHSCGLTLSGNAVCWGSNIQGQLGFATKTTSVDTAGFVHTDEKFTRISAGGLHDCGLTATPSAGSHPAGTALCWGFNDRGQLGNGGTATIFPDTATGTTSLTVVLGGLVFDSITAGYKHTCALTAGGVAYCWGDNSFGQLGDGSTTMATAPVAVSGGIAFKSLSAGYYHTCGVSTTNVAYCWGRNTPNSVQESVGGQLGDGTTTNRTVPTAVSGGLSFDAISAGEVTTCGVTTTSVAYCWGDNEYGQLGTGDYASSSVPVKVASQP